VNESNNKFYFAKDAEITVLEDSYEVRDINEYLKHADVLQTRPHRDTLETVDVCDDNNNNNNNNNNSNNNNNIDDNNGKGGEYLITLRVTQTTTG